ncbi:LysR family transcriptional regulator [Xylanimonas allomyrinae]|uniref:LysR family transcriptional regulator n=1 Tax=Xylanimonas allomyrinae TaxID=2509459 RepID=A0A4P6EIM3_9MICO|nr:LysR family transcriptional regulator [Xylanimonas allomyrinae]QAY62145.1 LysR family transcriptional regulator [Xylanimonas allomyrinae]
MSDALGVSHEAGAPSDLSLSDIRFFLAIARSGSLRAAASQLFVSQPSLTRVVARLEARLGVPLLVRGPRGTTLTEHGEALITSSRRVLDAVSALQRDVAAPGEQHLHIGATATSARTLLSPYLTQWVPRHRDVRLTAVEDGDVGLAIRLDNGDCDVAVISAYPSRSFESLRVMSVQVHAYAPPGHRLFHTSDAIAVGELARVPLLLNGDGFPSTDLVVGAMEASLLQPEIAYECSAGQTLAAMAEAGLGVAVFGNTAIMRGFNLRRRAVVDAAGKPLRFDLHVAWKRQRATPLIREFGIGLATFHNGNADEPE